MTSGRLQIETDFVVGSKGFCLAKAYVFKKRLHVERRNITTADVDSEIARLDLAMQKTAEDISKSKNKAEKRHGKEYAAIFDSHMLMLEDPSFKPNMIANLKKNLVNIETIVNEAVMNIQKRFLLIPDPYLRERAIDIKDVGNIILRHLIGLGGPAEEINNEPYVLIAEEVTPSELLEFSSGKLKGVCLESGGATSHVAILADALSIPSVFGVRKLTDKVKTGETILLNTIPEKSVFIISPTSQDVAAHTSAKKKAALKRNGAHRTKDGENIALALNVARAEEIPNLEETGVKRIGLFRSEFTFMDSLDWPSEEYQESVYSQITNFASDGLTFRTLDIGSDKPVKYLPMENELNPAMGWRSVRFSLDRPDILKAQLKAAMRAANGKKVLIIFPMVSVPSELEKIASIYAEAAQEADIKSPPEWGIMLEVPSAAYMLDYISKYTKNLSLGTNDLLQFFYGIDRTNGKINRLAACTDVPFLRFLNNLVKDAKKLGFSISVCGEMASNSAGLTALIGMGVRNFSIRPATVETISELISKIDTRKAEKALKLIIRKNSSYMDADSALQILLNVAKNSD